DHAAAPRPVRVALAGQLLRLVRLTRARSGRVGHLGTDRGCDRHRCLAVDRLRTARDQCAGAARRAGDPAPSRVPAVGRDARAGSTLSPMNLLIWGDTESSPELRHEVPVDIGDPFLYLESDGRRVVLTNALEEIRIASAAPELERVLVDELGRDELIAEGRSSVEIEQEMCVRAAQRVGIRDAVVPPEFPVGIADRLRAAGVELHPDHGPFTERRRQKSAAEMAGIRRATEAGLNALRAAATMLREAEIRGEELWHDGERLTSEIVRTRIREVCGQAGAPAPADIMVKVMGPDPHIGHDPGAGPLAAHTPILID